MDEKNLLVSDDRYKGLDKPLQAISVSSDKTFLTFHFRGDTVAIFRTDGDCCSESWIEHITLPDDLNGAIITEIIEEPTQSYEERPPYEYIQIYQIKFRTNKGETIALEFRNSSNGYYGGDLVRVL